MNWLKLALHILKRTADFTASGLLRGAVIGGFVGSIVGTICTWWDNAHQILNVDDTWFYIGTGFKLGILAGGAIGAVCGAVAFAYVALTQPAAERNLSVWRATTGAGWLSIVGATCLGGGAAFIGIVIERLMPGSDWGRPIIGLLFGSLIGFVAGLFCGAVLGGSGRLAGVSWRSVLHTVSLRDSK